MPLMTKLIVALNVGRVHWISVVIDAAVVEITLYDPLNQTASTNEMLRIMVYHVIPLLLPPQNANRYNFRMPQCLPTQRDLYICGVYVLYFLEGMAKDCDLEAWDPSRPPGMEFLRFQYLSTSVFTL